MPKYRFIIIGLIIFLPLFSIGQKKIMRLEIKAQIDARTNRYLDLGLKKAIEEEVSGVIIEMDTYGGAVYDANDMRNNILEFDIFKFEI